MSGLDAHQRLRLALDKTKALADRISDLIVLSEHNRLIVYSPTLTGQIPRSFAANAFNSLQQSMLRMELVQICTFWDRPDATLHHNSVLTVHALIDDDEVIETHLRAIQSDWPFGNAQVDDARRSLTELRRQIAEVASSPILSRVRNVRDKHLAHALDKTRAEQRGVVEPAKYGDEKVLLEKTEQVVEALYLWLNGTNFDLAHNRSMHRRHVEELWTNCTFSIPGR
ncbi:hypothetical protein ASC68_10720 [Devosia sp. Root105]|nr:hypothetical protein ASC68_10720 [Devosia sp. Root105]